MFLTPYIPYKPYILDEFCTVNVRCLKEVYTVEALIYKGFVRNVRFVRKFLLRYIYRAYIYEKTVLSAYARVSDVFTPYIPYKPYKIVIFQGLRVVRCRFYTVHYRTKSYNIVRKM